MVDSGGVKLALNYSVEAERLFDEGRIDVDYFKYPGLLFHMGAMEDLDAFGRFCARVAAKRPILLHGLYPAPHDLSDPDLQALFDDAAAARLIRMTRTPGLSFHPALAKHRDDVQTIIENAIFLREKYSGMAFVTIENVPDRHFGCLIRPEVITRLIHESGCGFLLDISHAFVAAHHLGMPLSAYLSQLPLDRTVEIHINGWVTRSDTMCSDTMCSDTMCHVKIHDEAYALLREILRCCTPQIVTIEYGRENDKFAAGIPLQSPEGLNKRAMAEIEEQVQKMTELIRTAADGAAFSVNGETI
ncbi:MAG: DUF692 family protein [Oscillospiraceae bacterium]|jgi:uncharacterized protein (UPF0276 family)|nr:DUF692 family protein [Oscillospiraceae bacterium]